MENKTEGELNAEKRWEERENNRKKETKRWIIGILFGLAMVYAQISLVERDWGNGITRGGVAVFAAISFLVVGIILERKDHIEK